MSYVIDHRSQLVKDFFVQYRQAEHFGIEDIIDSKLYIELQKCDSLDLSGASEDPFLIAGIVWMAAPSRSIKEVSLEFASLGSYRAQIAENLSWIQNLRTVKGVVINKQNPHFDVRVLECLFGSESIVRIDVDDRNTKNPKKDVSEIYHAIISKNTYLLTKKASLDIQNYDCIGIETILAIKNTSYDVLKFAIESLGEACSKVQDIIEGIFLSPIENFTEQKKFKISLKKVKGHLEKMPTIKESEEEQVDAINMNGQKATTQIHLQESKNGIDYICVGDFSDVFFV